MLLDQVEPVVELLEDREEVVDEAVEHLVEEARAAREERGVALEPARRARRWLGESSRRTVTR